jgi:ABC-type polysaccharide/polyol phosphate transport system ATPase subunit
MSQGPVSTPGGWAIELDDVRKNFGKTEIIRGATLQVKEGERVAIIGPNGAGKSTLFRILLGFLAPTSGHASIGEEHRAIFFPLLHALGGTGNGIQDRLLFLGFAEHAHQLFTGETVVAGHFTDKFGDLG